MLRGRAFLWRVRPLCFPGRAFCDKSVGEWEDSSWFGGQEEGERGTLTRSAPEGYGAFHEGGEFFGDGKAEAGAAVLAADGLIGLRERLEEVSLFGGVDPDTGIGDGEDELLIGFGSGEIDTSVRRGKLEGVGEKILKDLANAVLVEAVDRVAQVVPAGEVQEALVCGGLVCGEGRLEQFGDVDRLGGNADFPRFDGGELHDILDEGKHLITGGGDGLQALVILGWNGEVFEERNHGNHGRDGGADIVGQHGHEAAFGLIGLAGALQGPLGTEFGGLTRGQVVEAAEESGLVVCPLNGANGEAGPDGLALLIGEANLNGCFLGAVGSNCLQSLGEVILFRMERGDDGLADKLVDGLEEELGKGWIDLNEGTLEIGYGDADGALLVEIAKAGNPFQFAFALEALLDGGFAIEAKADGAFEEASAEHGFGNTVFGSLLDHAHDGLPVIEGSEDNDGDIVRYGEHAREGLLDLAIGEGEVEEDEVRFFVGEGGSGFGKGGGEGAVEGIIGGEMEIGLNQFPVGSFVFDDEEGNHESWTGKAT